MPALNSIKENKIFTNLYKQGNSVVTKQIVLYYKKNGLQINRVGITAGKKVGISVKRNRAKRLIRESLRLLDPKIKKGYDFVIVCRFAINGCMRQNIDRTLWYALNKAELLNK